MKPKPKKIRVESWGQVPPDTARMETIRTTHARKFFRAILPPTEYDPRLPLPDAYHQIADRALTVFAEAEQLYRDMAKRGGDTFRERKDLIMMLVNASVEVQVRLHGKLRCFAGQVGDKDENPRKGGRAAKPVDFDAKVRRLSDKQLLKQIGRDKSCETSPSDSDSEAEAS